MIEDLEELTVPEPIVYGNELFRGYHMILDCASCNSATYNKEVFYQFLKDVAIEIGAVTYGPPMSAHLDSGNPNSTGWFIAQVLEGITQITGNFITGTGEAYLDIVSSTPFDPEKVENLVRKTFQPGPCKIAFLARQA